MSNSTSKRLISSHPSSIERAPLTQPVNLNLPSLAPIGVIRSCYRQKFGIPRQPRLTTADESELELLAPYNQEAAVRGLSDFSHIWIQFIFHQTADDGWRPTVRPPKLGGKQRVGVFATRSTHRPNPIGLSVVRLKEVVVSPKRVRLKLGSSDLLDGTPVLDIKPYIPYADCIPEASESFTAAPPPLMEVRFSERAERECVDYETQTGRALAQLIREVLAQDPRPSYLTHKPRARHGVHLWDLNVVWSCEDGYFLVTHIERAP